MIREPLPLLLLLAASALSAVPVHAGASSPVLSFDREGISVMAQLRASVEQRLSDVGLTNEMSHPSTPPNPEIAQWYNFPNFPNYFRNCIYGYWRNC